MELNTNVVQYGSRTFGEIRTDLISLIRQMYPEILSDFTDSSVGAMMIDLNAGVGNNLAVNTDRAFQETQLDYAQQRASILNLAKNMGFNIPARRPSVTVVDFTVIIPVLGDSPDSSYYPILAAGAQVLGGGKIFETTDSIDWHSAVSNLGDPNRSIIPNTNSNGTIINYSVTKSEVVVNGSTNVFKRTISSSDIIPFFALTLPDPDITEITGVYLLPGTSYSTTPTLEILNRVNQQYYEVDFLAQQRVFEAITQSQIQMIKNGGLSAGRWKDITKKFIKEFTTNGYCKIIFGSGDADVNAFKEGFLKEGVSNRYFLENFLNNTALGEKLLPNSTLFVQYRTGGGSNSNVGSGTLTQLGGYNLTVRGSRQDYNQNVQRSLAANNPIPAIGGNDGLSVEQIRQLIKYNFSSQFRDVTLSDYLLQMYKMPGKFGSPFRANAFKQNNKIVISILDIGGIDGKLSNTSNTLLKENITEYLTQFRMTNDYVEVKDGKIFNLAFEVDVYVDNIADNQIANSIITLVRSYLDINNYEMNQDIFLGRLQREILTANGVINVISIKVFNRFGGQYSNNVVSQAINTTTGEITIINNTIYSTADSMFEIKYPEKDIKVLLRKSTT